ncbi:MAG TPA: hypothetical protein VFA76_10225 [Terriglobales bacterium]|nr:hypothetical protein [Terriglobales bacterium]
MKSRISRKINPPKPSPTASPQLDAGVELTPLDKGMMQIQTFGENTADVQRYLRWADQALKTDKTDTPAPPQQDVPKQAA